MLNYPDFFESGFRLKTAKDVYHYLDKVASQNIFGQVRGLCHRIVRSLVDIYKLKSVDELVLKINENIKYFSNCYDGEKNPSDIQKLKGMLREFEEELTWAHYGVDIKNALGIGNAITQKNGNVNIAGTLTVAGVITCPTIVASLGTFASVSAPFKFFSMLDKFVSIAFIHSLPSSTHFRSSFSSQICLKKLNITSSVLIAVFMATCYMIQ